MDYQEAIETIQYASAFNSENSRLTKALDVAISAMQELQALHDQGISLERLKGIDFRKDVVEHINYDAYMSLMDELERYKQIGTLDEVRYAIQELQELRSTDDNLYDHIEELKQAKYDIETFWEEPTTLSKAMQTAISALYEIKSYKQLGTLEEVRESMQELQGLQSETKCSDDAIALDEAIIHAREIAEKNYLQGMLCHANPNDDELDSCIECGREHEQLADWLEELKKYRQFGTPEGYRSALEAYEKCYLEKEEIANELYKYKQLGDLEEVREVVGKQNAKKPEKGEPYQWIDSVRVKGKYRDVRKTSYGHACPNCGKRVVKDMNFCRSCGQHIDWSDEE